MNWTNSMFDTRQPARQAMANAVAGGGVRVGGEDLAGAAGGEQRSAGRKGAHFVVGDVKDVSAPTQPARTADLVPVIKFGDVPPKI